MLVNIENFIKKKTKIIWGVILFSFGIYYIYNSYDRIIITPNILDYFIVICTLLLAFLPFVSEVSMMGFGLKKEIINTKQEMKDEIINLKSQMVDIRLTSTQTNQQNIIMGGEKLPELDQIKEMKEEIISKYFKGYSNIESRLDVSEESVFLFKVRATIEKYVDKVFIKVGLQVKKTMIHNKIKMLYNEKWINDYLYEYLIQVIRICNIGVHGETIGKEYIDFINKSTPFIINELKKIDRLKKSDKYCICPRCKYQGNSQYNNVCPRCGFVSNDD